MQLLRLQAPTSTLPSTPSTTPSSGPASALPESTVGNACRCGHVSRAHEHYRRGTDCALCGCGRFKTARVGLGLLGSLMGVARERSRPT